ncbi:hydrogen peroxide-inducible genes activator [Pyruvatibacter mobilis]|jgi:LysR family hydrogen peroxide-inducible transcriptional activator|uniref:LysR family transcriptional regulator n=1 Tax=Pyruvatibacter mobilis TaxID=1712261 RepID=A0A845Q761_9HYPH|nr:hydrogen peroxide-inducible genes activator [Pyruvatibacter mobilis]NBG94385.1 LysR family transcriptional regulator [Pyruvatibacter mobilis]QJD76675.1 hydrogen peroxide-inducible genes activator [Pyruvatibacter mobilis]GGD02446.1 LysR family transcriptional regulator [Pyruvatibacter mobilis]
MPTLRQLSYLVAIAETNHMGRAAERLGVTQPTLSAQIAELERKLGVSLAERGRAGVMLTDIGRDTANRARDILASVEALKDHAAGARTGIAGTLRLGVLPTIGPYLLPHILPALHARYPQLRLYVREDFPGPLEAGLHDGRFDMLLVSLPVDMGGLETAPLFREELQLALPHDHAAAQADRVPRTRLRGEDVLALETGHRYHTQVRDLCADLGAHLLPDYEGTSLDTLRQMTAMGAGLTFLPALYVHSEIGPRDKRRRAEVTTRSLTPRPPSRTVGMAWRRQAPNRQGYGELAELIRDRMKVLKLEGITVTS